ncbi:MAG TPA: NAD-binding protein, partial [Isosphaeraceae bacterium]|nr:NAD-binding protein [Isosphaeraceae bacterium]
MPVPIQSLRTTIERTEDASDEEQNFETPPWKRVVRVLLRADAIPFIMVLVVAWVGGSVLLYLAEHGSNPAFESWGEALWSVLVIMFSGLEVLPQTLLGRLLSLVVLGAGIGLVAVLTGAIASTLVDIRLRRREVSSFQMEDHLVLCNWAPRGLEWIREVHSKIIQDKRPVVIIHDRPEEIDLPDTADESAFNDVYIVKGDPNNEIILRRAKVQKAHSVVVLSDDRQGEHADGKTILTCIALQSLCRGCDVNIAVECKNPGNRHHLKKAGADEIISSDELGLRLLARTSLYHGMTHVYQELLSVGRDANEMYLVDVPQELIGRDFVELASLFLRYRTDKRSCL